MADSKITALTALTAADPANDMFPVVDVSDTSMAASGTTKRISINNILACSPSATLASATITGALTIGGATSFPASVINTSGGNPIFTPTASTLFLYSGSSFLSIRNQANTQEIFNLTPAGVYTFGDGAGGTRMTLNSTGLGVGVSPTYKLQSVGFVAATSSSVNGSGGNFIGAMLNSDDANSNVNPGVDLRRWTGTALNHGLTYIATNATGDTLFYNGTSASNTRATSLKMTLDASGNLLVGTTTGSRNCIYKSVAVGSIILDVQSPSTATISTLTYAADASGASATNTVFLVQKVNATSRSINAAGTVNASGADYAEYMTKAGDFVLAKGEIAGIDANGKLTNIFADAVSFVVKSTDPSYVGNDKWGVDLEGDALEAARQLVDRIAFAGQVPVNVTGAKAGDYIVPVADGTGIKGVAVSKPTFDQYQLAVGKVIAIDADGRARIIVKVA